MLKTTKELQDFILWCKQAKLSEVKVGEAHFVFSPLAFLPDESPATEFDAPIRPSKAGEEKNTSKTMADEADLGADMSDEDLLMWSARS